MLVPGGNLLGHLAAPKGVHVCRFEGAWDVNADESPQQQVAPAWLAFIQSLHEVVHPATRKPGASSCASSIRHMRRAGRILPVHLSILCPRSMASRSLDLASK